METARVTCEALGLIDEAWADELARRIAEVESGAVPLIPLDDALASIRASLDD